MREIVFLSGKGGTGKTSLAGAFAVLMEGKVLADADVDAANLHLLLDPTIEEEGTFLGSKEAIRNTDRCIGCGRCREVCRFAAIDAEMRIDPFLCEGCGACVTACPTGAIDLAPRVSGRWALSRTRRGPLASAELDPGEETSGKLVTLVREKARARARAETLKRILIDGSPGIGCPVIASATGASTVILVTEPSASALHDLERILQVVRHFRISTYLVINKADLSPELTDRVTGFAEEHDLPILGQIPYDPVVPRLMTAGKSAVENPESPAGRAMRAVFDRFMHAFAART